MSLPFMVLQLGKPLEPELYQWNNITNTFITTESHLMIQTDIQGLTFVTGNFCFFITSSLCRFITGYNCTFNTMNNCEFYTNDQCTFDVGSNCTFFVGIECVVVRRDVFEVSLLYPSINMVSNRDTVPGWANKSEIESILFEQNL